MSGREAAGEAWRIVRKSLMILTAGIAAGVILLTLAYMLPVSTENREASYEMLDSEGYYPRTSIVSFSTNKYFHAHFPDVLDNATDKIILQTAMDSSEGNPLVRAMRSYSDYVGEYNYYWHGYVMILRPLFLLFNFSEVRILNGALQLLLMLLLALVIQKEKGIRYFLMFLTSHLLLSPVTVSMGLQFSGVFYIAYGATLILLLKKDFFFQKSRYVYFFLTVGMLTSFFDLLTYPLFAWGCPLLWWIITEKTERKEWEWLKYVVVSGCGWIMGYALMWVAKWGMASLILGTNVFQRALNEAFFRSGGDWGDRLYAVYTNWKHYGYKIYAIILAGWLLWWFAGSVKRGWCKSIKRYAYFLTGMSGIVWYFLLSNHTSIHHFFTYRIFGVSILAFLAIVLDSVPVPGIGTDIPGTDRQKDGTGAKGIFRKDMPSIRKLTERGLVWGIAVLISAPLALIAKEDVRATNGPEAFQRIPMEEKLEAEFTPTFSIIRSFGLGLECAEETWQYKVGIWEGDVLKYQETISAGDGEEANYRETEVLWRLRRGKTYTLTVEAAGSDAPIYVWVTKDGNMPLIEYGNLLVDGELTAGQMLTGITYSDRAGVPEGMKFFLILTWTGIIMAAVYVFSGGGMSEKVI